MVVYSVSCLIVVYSRTYCDIVLLKSHGFRKAIILGLGVVGPFLQIGPICIVTGPGTGYGVFRIGGDMVCDLVVVFSCTAVRFSLAIWTSSMCHPIALLMNGGVGEVDLLDQATIRSSII